MSVPRPWTPCIGPLVCRSRSRWRRLKKLLFHLFAEVQRPEVQVSYASRQYQQNIRVSSSPCDRTPKCVRPCTRFPLPHHKGCNMSASACHFVAVCRARTCACRTCTGAARARLGWAAPAPPLRWGRAAAPEATAAVAAAAATAAVTAAAAAAAVEAAAHLPFGAYAPPPPPPPPTCSCDRTRTGSACCRAQRSRPQSAPRGCGPPDQSGEY